MIIDDQQFHDASNFETQYFGAGMIRRSRAGFSG
jgi:hypothetical protein